jgi:hypothetical protein
MLASLLPKRPQEFYDRLMTLMEVRFEPLRVGRSAYQFRRLDETVQGLETCLNVPLNRFLDENGLAEVEEEVRQRIETVRTRGPFRLSHNADFGLARLCYGVCRALKPAVVLETGVAYGVTSAFILKALEVTGHGLLHSVDLPPLGRDADGFVGVLIPKALKGRWRLHRGASKRTFPFLLPRLKRIDIFVHDSLHTYKNITREFQTITPYLARPAVVIADDVGDNAAFLNWVREARPAFWSILREVEKPSVFGVSAFC